MVEDYVVRRREYVADVRKSFDSITNDMEEPASDATEHGSSFLFFKIRLFLALFIFGVFLYYKYTGAGIGNYQAEDVIDIISDNQYYKDLQEYVMIQETNK